MSGPTGRPRRASRQSSTTPTSDSSSSPLARTGSTSANNRTLPELSAPELVRYAAITAELERRDHVERLALVIDPPAHLTAALGTVPERLDARERWQQTAGHIERYRDHYGITDPERALGEHPQALRQRSDRRQLRPEIQHDRESLTRDPDRGRELE